MIKMNKISIMQLHDLVFLSYEGDSELMDKYHVQKFDLLGAVKSTMDMIHEMAVKYKLECYKVIYNKIPIGYVVSYEGVLYSFGINIKFRKKTILMAWWEELKRTIGWQFVCRLYRNNTRAIEFLKKQQMIEVEVNEKHNFVTLLNSK